MTEAVKAVDLVKIYEEKEKVEALKGVNLSIEEGVLFTLLGPNGAGKTMDAQQPVKPSRPRLNLHTTRLLP